MVSVQLSESVNTDRCATLNVHSRPVTKEAQPMVQPSQSPAYVGCGKVLNPLSIALFIPSLVPGVQIPCADVLIKHALCMPAARSG